MTIILNRELISPPVVLSCELIDTTDISPRACDCGPECPGGLCGNCSEVKNQSIPNAT